MRPRTPIAALLVLFSGCQCGADPSPAPPPDPAPAASAAPEPPAVPPEPSAAERPAREIVGASQILVAFKGAELAAPAVTRSKDQARRRAEELSWSVIAPQYDRLYSDLAGRA